MTDRILPHKLHLLEQRVAIGLVAALDGLDGLVVHEPHLAVGHGEQSRVVRDHEHAALELVDGVSEGVDGLDVASWQGVLTPTDGWWAHRE